MSEETPAIELDLGEDNTPEIELDLGVEPPVIEIEGISSSDGKIIADVVIDITDNITPAVRDEGQDETVPLIILDEGDGEEELPLLDDSGDSDTQSVAYFREGIDTPVKDSLKNIIKWTGDRLMMLEDNISTPVSDESKIEKLLESVTKVQDSLNLTAEQRGSILTAVSSGADEDFIIRDFLNRYGRLDARKKMQLTSYVSQVRADYNSYLSKYQLMSRLLATANRFVLDKFISGPQEALEVLERYAQTDKVSYIRSIQVNSEQEVMICGNCGESTVLEEGAFRLVVSDGEFRRGEFITLLPNACVCASCNHLNIFTVKEFVLMNSDINGRYEDVLQRWGKGTDRLAESSNIVGYNPPREFLPTLYPDVYQAIAGSEIIEEVEVREEGFNLHSWFEETKRFVAILGTRRLRIKPTTEYDDSKGAYDYDGKDHADKMRSLTLHFCNMFKYDYNELRNRAIAGLLGYIEENSKLASVLDLDMVSYREGLSYHAAYFDAELDELERLNLYRAMNRTIGVSNVDEVGTATVEEELRKLVTATGKEATLAAECREHVINQLDRLVELYRFVPLRTNSNFNIDSLLGVLADNRVRGWVERVADLMVLHHLNDDITDYWGTLHLLVPGTGSKMKKLKHSDFIGRTRNNKTIGDLLLAYSNYFKGKGAASNPLGMREDMLSNNPAVISFADAVNTLRLSIESNDYYNFCFAVKELNKIHNTARSFSGIIEFIKSAEAECVSFCNKQELNSSGNAVLDYYIYHYGDLFTVEEITAASADLISKSKKSFRLAREEGETFSAYLRRLRNHVSEEGQEIDPDQEKLARWRQYYGDLYGLFAYFNFIVANKSRLVATTLIEDVVYYSYMFGERFMYEFLGIVKLPLESAIDELPYISGEVRRLEVMLRNLTYLDDDMNRAFSGDPELTVEGLVSDNSEAFVENLRFFDGLGEKALAVYTR